MLHSLLLVASFVPAAAWSAPATLPAQEPAVQDAAARRTPAGRWAGRIERAKLDLEVTLVWEGEQLAGTIDIPAQGLERGQLVDCALEGDRVRMRIDGVPGEPTFDGALDDAARRITGKFTQGGAQLDFSLSRVAPTGERAAVVLAGFDEWVTRQLKGLRVPGLAAAVVWQGEVVLARGYGLADTATQAPVTADTLFGIGSTTKAFTAFAIAQAVEDDLLDWDEPVRRWLPELQLEDDVAELELTLRDMCSHRSGLPRHDLLWYANPSLAREEFVARLAHLEPTAGFRERWQYNNLMFAAAGVALQRVTGGTWEERVRARILVPLGMTRTTFGLAETLAASDHAVPHDRVKGKDVVIPFRDITEIGPAGSIHSSANDMARWLAVLLGRGEAHDQRLLSVARFMELVTPVSVVGAPGSPTAYGLGWMLDAVEGHTRVHHGGGIDGFTTQVELYPDDRLGIFVVTNRASVLTSLAATQLAERFLELEVSDTAELAATQVDAAEEIGANMRKARESERIADAPHARPLAAYAASYRHPGYGDLEVTCSGTGESGALSARYGTLELPLEHWHFETFRCGESATASAAEGLLMQFRDDLAGFVDAVEVQLEASAKPIRFERLADTTLRDVALLERLVGEYSLMGQAIRVTRAGSTLTATITGQPALQLEPATHGRFKLDVADGYWVRFELPDAGPAGALVITQPNGTFRAERRSDG
jgi:CubicO group peptidase (beta-lactamase class C family)